MKELTFEKAATILSAMTITKYIDHGTVDYHQGNHPLLGAITLIINSMDGRGVLICIK